MDRSEISRPISITLNGSNYVHWAEAMTSFLKARRVWRVVTGNVTKPVKKDDESDEEFRDREDEWDSKNGDIITWCRNTSSPSINQQFGRFTTAKEVWDFLQHRYTTKDLAHQYQLLTALHIKTQPPDQSIDDFVSEMHAIWDQLAMSEPVWTCDADAAQFASYRDQQRVITLLMALHSRFEPVRASLLHRHPLPSLDDVITELLSEETRLGVKSHNSNSVLAIHPSQTGKTAKECTYCHETSHVLLNCLVRICKYCHKKGPKHFISDCYKNPNRRTTSKFVTTAATKQSSGTEQPSNSTSSVTNDDLAAILKQVLSGPAHAMSVTSGNSNAWSVSSGNSWYFDSGCCNHMTSDASIFLSKESASHLSPINTADGSQLYFDHLGPVSTSNLFLPATFHIPKLTINLISVGQLCDLGLTVIFSSSGCHVQDPRTGQTIGIGRKVGRMFELVHLRTPPVTTAATTAASTPSASSLHLWHSRLGHVSVDRLRSLISSGRLGTVSSEKFSCLSCQLGKQPSLPFNKSDSISSAPFDLIHSDVWGPSPHATMGGSR